jgi:hypothetical protein
MIRDFAAIMRETVFQQLARFLVVACGLALSGAGEAADPIAGQSKYLANCVICHDSPPDYRAIRAANAPDELALALNTVSPMGVLIARLSRTDIEDISAYLGDATLNQNVLALAKQGSGSGTVVSIPGGITCGGLCSSSFVPGTQVTLQASARRGSMFVGWTGECRGKRLGACQVNVDRAQLVNARFERNGPTDDLSGLWWAGGQDAGWGISISHGGSSAQLYVLLYIYDARGQPVWYVMPGGEWRDQFRVFQGPLLRATSAPFSQYTSSLYRSTAVGEVELRFSGTANLEMRYVLHGIAGSKLLRRGATISGVPENTSGLFGISLPVGAPILQSELPAEWFGQWWGGVSEYGWSKFIGSTASATGAIWSTFDDQGQPIWLLYRAGATLRSASTDVTGVLYMTQSAPWLGAIEPRRSVTVAAVGELSISAKPNGDLIATSSVSADGIRASKQEKLLSRLPQ